VAVNTTELRQKRAKALADCREILDRVDKENRAQTAEERSQYDKIWADYEDLGQQVEDGENRNKLERVEEEERQAEKKREEERRSPKAKIEEKEEERRRVDPFAEFKDFNLTEEQRVRRTDEYHRGFCKRLFGRGTLDEEEHRAQTAGKAEKGGYLYASEQFVNELISDVDDAVPFRALCRQFTLATADTLGVPTFTSKASDADWTSELGVPTRDTLKFGKRALTAHPLAKEIIVSKVLIQKAPNIISIVRGELARVVGEAYENSYMTGDGHQQCLGLFTDSADGIDAATRDTSTGNTSSLVKFDNLKTAKFTLKQAYWGNAQWLMHRDIMQQLSKEKDGEGRYLMQDSVLAGTPLTMLLGFPVVLSEFAPNTTGSGNYAYAFGDFSWYWIVDGLDPDILRLEELYARENQDLFIIRGAGDGAPVKAEAFVRGTFA